MNPKPTYKELEEELASLKTSNNLIEKSPIVRFVWKNQENWPVEYVSENVKNIFGYSADDFIKNKIVYSEIIFPEDLPRVENEVSSQSKTGFSSIEHEQYRIISKSGKIKWLNDITLIRRNRNNEITHFEGFIIDITELKESEQALKESEKKYSSLFNFSVEGIAIHKMIYNENGEYIDYEITDVNSAFERITGLKRDDSIGRKATTLYKVKVAPFIDNYNKVAVSGEPISFEHDFEPMKKSFNISVFSYIKGEFITFFSDITERKEANRKLIKSEDKLSKTLIAASDGTWDWNLITDEVYFDPQYYKMAGYDVNEFPHEFEEFQKRIHPDDIENVMVRAQQHLEGKLARFIVEFRFKKKSGDWLWILGRGLIVEHDKNNKPLRFIGTHSDITERKKTERELQNSKEKFHTIADFAYDWEYWASPQGGFVYISPSCERITGYSPNEFKQNPGLLTSIVHPDDVNNWDNHKHNVFNNAEVETIEFRIITKSGEERWIGHVCQTVYDCNGVNIGIRGCNRDITEKKLAESALEESKQKFESMILNSPDLIMSQNANGKIEYISPQCEEILGYTAEEIKNIDISKLIHPDDIEKTTKTESKTLGGRKLNNFEYRFFKKNGDIVWLNHTARPITVDGKTTEILSTVRDITKRMLHTEALKENEIQLRELNATKDKFFSIISHDLRSPLGSIIALSEVMAKEDIGEYNPEMTQKMFATIHESSERTFGLLENLLEWSKIQTGGIVFNPVKINSQDLIKEAMALAEINASKKNIQISVITDKNFVVYADVHMISTVIRNLLSNAVKFTPDGGSVKVNCTAALNEKDEKIIKIIVSDTGIGIGPEKINNLFKIEESKSSPGTVGEKGSGLGLILCKEFVEKHGGKIWLESEIDKGSRFYFSIPNK